MTKKPLERKRRKLKLNFLIIKIKESFKELKSVFINIIIFLLFLWEIAPTNKNKYGFLCN